MFQIYFNLLFLYTILLFYLGPKNEEGEANQ
jgi:hypothetical protein